MPHLRIQTNIAKMLFDSSFMKSLTSKMAHLTGLPENKIIISVSAEDIFHINDSFDPAANVTFSTIGQCDKENNAKYAKAIFESLNGVGVSSERIDIVFRNESVENVAWNGKLLSQWIQEGN